MKKLVHTQESNEICIYKINSNFIEGSFFGQKPEIGDIILSHTCRDGSSLIPFLVKKVIEKRDANIHSECTFDKTNAWMQLEVENVLESINKRDIGISIMRNL